MNYNTPITAYREIALIDGNFLQDSMFGNLVAKKIGDGVWESLSLTGHIMREYEIDEVEANK